MVNMKVLVYFNLRKIKLKKIKSPSSMRNGRFHSPKCRGKVQKSERKLSKGFFQTSLFLLPTVLG
jgi:hypothetical protein